MFHAFLNEPEKDGPLFVAHHGAGSSAMSFALLAKRLRTYQPESGFLAYDARGHGSTHFCSTSVEKESSDYSLQELSKDLRDVLSITSQMLGWDSLPPLILVGHSLGGAVVVDCVRHHLSPDMLIGLSVVDIVEGSAKEALHHMHSYLASRPRFFPTQASAIEWQWVYYAYDGNVSDIDGV